MYSRLAKFLYSDYLPPFCLLQSVSVRFPALNCKRYQNLQRFLAKLHVDVINFQNESKLRAVLGE